MEETLIACQTFSLKQTGDFTTDESATVRSRESFVCMSQAWDEPRIISNIAAVGSRWFLMRISSSL